MVVQKECRNCGELLDPPRTKWCSDRCRMQFSRRGKRKEATTIFNEFATNGNVMEDEQIEPAMLRVADRQSYSALIVKNRELRVHVDLLIEERDRLQIQYDAMQERLIKAERNSAANEARIELIPRLQGEIDRERESRIDAERAVAVQASKLESLNLVEAKLEAERKAHAETMASYTQVRLVEVEKSTIDDDDMVINDENAESIIDMSNGITEPSNGSFQLAPAYRKHQLYNVVIILLLGVVAILAILVGRMLL